MPELTANMMFILGIVAALYAEEAVGLLFAFIFAPMFGMECKRISFFGMGFTRFDGKWQRTREKFKPLLLHYVGFDFNKRIENGNKAGFLYGIVSTSVKLLLGIAAVILGYTAVVRYFIIGDDMWDGFLAGFVLNFAVQCVLSLVFRLYTHLVVGKRLGGYVTRLADMVRNGVPFREMNLQPVNMLPYQNATKSEIMLYYSFYLQYLVSVKRINELQQPIYEMTDYFMNAIYVSEETLSYYWLIFYYSRYEVNPQLANLFFGKVKEVILTDPDANAKRVLAYYYFGIYKDISTARHYIAEAYAVLDRFSVHDEREMERMFLTELEGFIDNWQKSLGGG